MKEAWTVRRAALADVDAVLALERRVADAPHWSRQDYAAIFGADDGGAGGVLRRLFVVGPMDSLTGFSVGSILGVHGAAGAPVLRWGELESVAVADTARRKGIGRALCVAVLDWCREEGAVRVELEVRAGSGGAQVLYRQLGFREAGRRRGYYSDPGDDAVLMCLPLRRVEG